VISEGAVTISKVDLLNKTFSKSLFGYRPEEVDQLVHEAAESIGLLAEREKSLTDNVAKLEKILGDYRGREETLRDALLTTQKVVENLKENAREEAARIVFDARQEAGIITGEAQAQLERIRAEIDELSRRRARFEKDLKTVIDAHVRLLQSGGTSDDEHLNGAFTFSEEGT
jgi:cell division initiation protein